jgi:hypothetical protein
VTREGQLIFFAQSLHSGGRWARLLRSCPLPYHGNRGSQVVDVLGPAALSILGGHWRDAHSNSVRGDSLNPPLLGMTRAVSEEVVRRAMNRIDEPTGLAWLAGEWRDCVAPVLSQPWILDIDCTVKPLYGHQQGAQIGDNPQKPGRPSHCDHSYFMANTRMCLGVEVCGGKEHAARHGLPGLWSLLDAGPRTHWPAFLRGDCAPAARKYPENPPILPADHSFIHVFRLKPAVRSETLARMRWLIAGIVLGVLGVRIFDAISKHEPVVRPPPLELSEGAAAPVRDSGTIKKLPMRIRVDAIDPSGTTLITERKDGVRIRSVVTDRTEIRNGFAEATFAEIKVGDMVNGSRVKRAEDKYEVLSVTKIEPSGEALDRKSSADLRARPTEHPQDSVEHDEQRP